MKKKIMNKLNAVAFFVWILSGSAVDCESWIPLMVFVASTIWLALFLKYSEGGECDALD